MWRALLEPAAFFVAPFVLYVLYLLLRGRHPLKPAHWPGSAVVSLTIAGLAIAVAGMLWFGFGAQRQTGAYVPAHVENGKVVPGHFQ
jgi:exosortase/archaeosortase